MGLSSKKTSILVSNQPFDEPDFSRILIVGSDQGAGTLATRLSKLGFEVILAGDIQLIPKPENIEIIKSSTLLEIRGFVGSFIARFKSGKDYIERDAGAVVLSGEPTRAPKFFNYRLAAENRVIPISQALANGDLKGLLEPADGTWRHVIILSGLSGESDPGRFSETLDLALKFQSLEKVQTHIFIRSAKVAATGLEKLYRETRLSGAIFYKFHDNTVSFIKDQEQWRVEFIDPELEREVQIEPSLIVVDEDLYNLCQGKVLPRAVIGPRGSMSGLQPESVRFTGVTTPRRGLFTINGAKDAKIPANGNNDVDTVTDEILELRNLINKAPETYAKVDPEKCAICLTCYRQCPHWAIGFEDAAKVNEYSCQACGICVSACPTKAIDMVIKGSGKNHGKLEDLNRFKDQNDLKGKIAVFACKNSAFRAMEAASGGICRDLYPVVVQCAGTLDQSLIMEAFIKGAEAVMVMACHSGNCASVYGSDIARSRVSLAANMLEEIGINPKRLSFMTLASNSIPEFAEAAMEMSRSVGLREPV